MIEQEKIKIALEVVEKLAKTFNQRLEKMPKKLRANSRLYNEAASLFETMVILQEIEKKII